MKHEFVGTIPDDLLPSILYVSIGSVVTIHLCACGCGSEIVLPLHPTKWRMTFDGSSVSMHPSIGSRTLPCRSHYWIDKGHVRWAAAMDDDEFAVAFDKDRRAERLWRGRDLEEPRLDRAAGSITERIPPPTISLAPRPRGMMGSLLTRLRSLMGQTER